ncbi:MAG TPA: hypothetical protein GXX18_20110 [Bacillales bacterium]|nr:hypothetical protein [Bacillales bacterium]
MKYIKLLSLTIFILLFSCSSVRTLKIYRENLKTDILKASIISLDHSENPFYCDLNVLEGKKIFVQESLEFKKTHFAAVDYIYYVGVDCGEFGGWVGRGVHFEDFSKRGEIIVKEQCKGLIKVDNEKVLLLTGLGHLITDKGKLYMLGSDSIHELYNFNSCPQVYLWEDEVLYIKTTDKLYSYKINEEPIVLYEFEDDEKYIYSISLIKIDQSLFLGSLNGILEFQMDTKNLYWYPVN